jgi:tRNA A-37 threonylcarbamoyl transferase component Bud32/membrane-associated phospholipid phosphatase
VTETSSNVDVPSAEETERAPAEGDGEAGRAPDGGDLAPPADEHEPLTDVADEDEGLLPLGRRRRPAGDPRPYPFHLRPAGWIWLSLGLAVLGIWVWLFATGGPAPTIERFDQEILDRMLRARTPLLTSVMQVFAALAGVWGLIAIRFGTVLVLVVTERLRHLVAFVVSALAVRLVALVAADAIGRPRPLGIAYATGWEGYSHPSRQIAALAVATVGAAFALAPAGAWRRGALGVCGVAIGIASIARVYLGVDHPTDVLFAAILGVALPLVTFRILCPDGIFPVQYRRGRAAHIEIEGQRERRLREALEEQMQLELVSFEPFGEGGSAGSTPLKLRVRPVDGGRARDVFAKLYAESHLRADRWYKLGRAIRFGALEDERAFNSVRQLVEHEDYMLRVLADLGVPTVRAYGFIELEPEREYVILMGFLRGAEEADADAAIDEATIDDALHAVETMWARGVAHRDIKPSNVMIRRGEVHLVDVAFAQVRPSPWRQVVDLANMMLLLALASDAETVYERATAIFEPEEIAEAFAATHGITMPRELRDKLRDDDRDLLERFRRLAPSAEPIAIQRWSVRRVVATVRTAAVAVVLGALVVANLANPHSP